MATNPIIADYRRLQRLPVTPDAPPVIAQPLASTLPQLPSPAQPIIRQQDPAIAATNTRLLGDQSEYQRKLDTGSGISQIKNPLLRGLATAGDVAERILLPRAEAVTPGTEGQHQRLLGIDQARVGQDIGNQGAQAKTQEENALTDFTLQRPAIMQSQIEQKQQAVRDRVAQAAASRGQNVVWDDEGVPSFSDDHESQAFKDHQALSAMHEATATKSQILADIQKNHYIPGTPEWAEAQKKIAQVDQRLQIAMGSLGLRAKGLQLRQNDQNANFYGMGPDGQPLPNAPQFQDDAGNVTTGGLKGASTAIKSQGKAGQFKDLGGSIQHAYEALEALHNNGGDLSDSRVVAAMSDPHSTIGKIINGKLVKGGLSDQQVKAIGALNQLREQAGILRQSTGGTAAEAQAQRILETIPTAGDTKATARNKFDELNGVYNRLTPSVVSTAGGLSVNGKGGHAQPNAPKETRTYQGHTYVKGADGWHLQQ